MLKFEFTVLLFILIIIYKIDISITLRDSATTKQIPY